MTPPQVNATLTRVTGSGPLDEPGATVPGGAEGAAKFTGSARVYYREQEESFAAAGDRDIAVRRTIFVDTRQPSIAWSTDDVLTFTIDGVTGEQKGTVQRVTGSRLGALAGSGVETTKLELEAK